MQSKSTIKAVIFDLGGVILRTEDSEPRMTLAHSLGRSRAELEEAIFNNPVSRAGERGEASQDSVWKEAARLLDLPVEAIPDMRRAFFAGDRVDFELVRFIQSLRPAFSTALLSNNWTADLEGFLGERLSIVNTFDVVVSSAQHKIRKPDPAIFQITLDLLDARPDEAVFVDDFETNTTAAAALGFHTVLFHSTAQAVAELRALLRLAE